MGSKGKNLDPCWFPADYWDRPPSRKDGDTGLDGIFRVVGMALTAWEMAEQALADLYLVLAEADGAATANAIARTYGSIESNTGRRNAITSVAEVYFHPHFSEDYVSRPFNELLTHIRNASKRRDDIAHGITQRIGASTKEGYIIYGCFLLPVDYNNSRTNAFANRSVTDPDFPFNFMRGHYRYTSEDILSFAEKFSALRLAIHRFCGQVRKIDGEIALVGDGLREVTNRSAAREHASKERKGLYQQQQKQEPG